MDGSGETGQPVADAVAALERQMAEQNRLTEQRLVLQRRQVDAAEDYNRLVLRSVVQAESNGEAYRKRMAQFPKQQRMALAVLAILLIAFLVALFLFPSASVSGHRVR